MDLNHLLVWTVAAGCGITLLQLPWSPRGLRLAILPTLILVILGLALLIVPDWAGVISGVFFFLFMMVPAWGTVLLNSLLLRRRYRAAGWLAKLLSVLRPGRDARRLPIVLRAMQLAQRQQPEQAVTILRSIAGTGSPLERMAFVLLTRLTADWQHFLNWADLPENRSLVRSDPNLLETWFQAWGETGRRSEMLRHHIELRSQWSRLPEFAPSLIRLKLAAFYGEERSVVLLAQGRLAELPAEVKAFWRATAVQVAGHREEAARDFYLLLNSRDAGMALSAKRRLEHPLPDLEAAPLESWQKSELQQIERQAAAELQREACAVSRNRRHWGTWGLVAVLGLVFLLEIPGGSESFENLERMGAMLIPVRSGREFVWRMVAAAFLHFGVLHLIMNVLGLLVLGRRIEQEWGTWRMVLTYLLAAIGSIGLAPFFVSPDPYYETITLVGASGGVMGLLGGLLMQSLAHLLQGRSRLAGREFLTLLAIVLMQVTFDANTPNVSSEAHLLGMSIGIVCGAIWNFAWWIRRR